MIIGVDPGPESSAFAVVLPKGYEILAAGKIPNDELVKKIRSYPFPELAIESIQSYGMVVGRSVFDTCYMIGRVIQVCKDGWLKYALYPRPEYARSLCGCQKISDSIIRSALMLRFGGDRKGEPLHLLRGETDKRSAFAVAVHHIDRKKYPAVASPGWHTKDGIAQKVDTKAKK